MSVALLSESVGKIIARYELVKKTNGYWGIAIEDAAGQSFWAVGKEVVGACESACKLMNITEERLLWIRNTTKTIIGRNYRRGKVSMSLSHCCEFAGLN